MAWTYILRCSDNTLYVGSTTDLNARMEQHFLGKGCAYTAKRLPVTLAWAQEFDRVDDAWLMERKLHGWSRTKKLALIDGDLARISGYSARNRQAR